jgi:hypothetical protein
MNAGADSKARLIADGIRKAAHAACNLSELQPLTSTHNRPDPADRA